MPVPQYLKSLEPQELHRVRKRLEIEISSTDLAIQTLNLISQEKADQLKTVLMLLDVNRTIA